MDITAHMAVPVAREPDANIAFELALNLIRSLATSSGRFLDVVCRVRTSQALRPDFGHFGICLAVVRRRLDRDRPGSEFRADHPIFYGRPGRARPVCYRPVLHCTCLVRV